VTQHVLLAHPVGRPHFIKRSYVPHFQQGCTNVWFNWTACALQAAAAGAAAGGGPKKRLEDAVGWIKGLGAAATNIVGGSSRAADTAEDPEYIKVGTMSYINSISIDRYCRGR
jgi:hypothetical protein